MSRRSNKIELLVRKRPVKTLIGLPDNNEKALTYALGYMIANSKSLRDKFLKYTLGKTYSGKSIRVELEEIGGHGRYDISLYIDKKLRLIIEGKIYKGQPGPDQCYKYIKNLSKDKSYQTRQLLLIYDDFDEKKIGERIEYLQEEVIKLTKKCYGIRKHWKKYFCTKPVTWWHIQEWAEELAEELEDESESREKDLLIEYAKYLAIERYSHGFLRDLEDRGFSEEQIERIEHAISKLEKMRDTYNEKIELIPAKSESRYHYTWGDGKKEGFCAFRKGTKTLFGIYFDYGKDKYICVYVALPEGLTGKLEQAKDSLKGDWDEDNMECIFDMTEKREKAIGSLVNSLYDFGFFKEAIKQSKGRTRE